MKVLGLILMVAVAVSGCAHFQQSESIDASGPGYAAAQMRHEAGGPVGNFTMAGGGGGWGSSGSGGAGAGAISASTGPAPSNAYNFARAVAMINYSKTLRNIKYDEMGGVVSYEFAPPYAGSSAVGYQSGQSKAPSCFGRQPVE